MKYIEGDYIIEMGDIIRNFDCRILSIDCKDGGGYFTVFPISDKGHRDSLKEKGRILPDKVVVIDDDQFTTFHITDDWGVICKVRIDNIHYQSIKNAISKAKEYGLLE